MSPSASQIAATREDLREVHDRVAELLYVAVDATSDEPVFTAEDNCVTAARHAANAFVMLAQIEQALLHIQDEAREHERQHAKRTPKAEVAS